MNYDQNIFLNMTCIYSFLESREKMKVNTVKVSHFKIWNGFCSTISIFGKKNLCFLVHQDLGNLSTCEKLIVYYF